MKSLGDAIVLRNRMIALLEEADTECSAGIRERLLTFVVAGGGFAGVETAAAVNDFVREALRFYPNLAADDPHGARASRGRHFAGALAVTRTLCGAQARGARHGGAGADEGGGGE
jgi:hypothetical protein